MKSHPSRVRELKHIAIKLVRLKSKVAPLPGA